MQQPTVKSADRKSNALTYVLGQLEAVQGIDLNAFLARDLPCLCEACFIQVRIWCTLQSLSSERQTLPAEPCTCLAC